MNVFQYWLVQGRRASFRMLLLALVLAVASVSSVGIFSARIEAALQRDATQMLGGDLVVASNNNPTQTPWYALFSQSQYMGLDKASSVQFPSVLSSELNDVFVSLKAVDAAYPLMGTLRVADQKGTSEEVKHGPPRGEVWVDQPVLDTLGLQLGQTIQIGQLSSTISKVILLEPERNGGFVNFAPRAMIHLDDLPPTGLLGIGSRAKWRLYLNGPSNVLNVLAQQIQPQLSQSEEILTLEKGRPEIHKTLETASSFLSMAALIASLIACVGIALSSHHFAKEQAKDLSILKSLGFTPKQLLRTSLWGVLIVTIVVGGLGAAIGWLAHWILLFFLSDILRVELPMAGLYHLPLGILLSAVLISSFAIFPLLNALKIPTLVVLRQQHTQLKSTRFQRFLSISIGALGAWGMCVLVMSNIILACLLFFGFVGVFLVFSALLLGLLKILSWGAKRWVQRLGINVIQNMSKQALSLVLQGGGLSIGLAALFTLALVQGDLIEHWQAAIPKQAPNRFVFNIQADQKDEVYSMLQQHSSSDIRLYPMVRGRLVAINGKTVSENTYSDQRAKNLIQREFNLSYANQVPSHNRIIQGQWLDPQFKTPQISLEKSMAERLQLKIGDTLGFDIAGTTVSATISSIRQLRWDSMEVNFLAMFAQERLQNLPETWITSVYLPPSQAHLVSRQLLKSHPNLTVLNTEQLLTQVRNILGQVAKAAQFVFLFTLLAGGVVMLTTVSLGAPEKARQAAIYRALGASSHQLQKAAWVELGILGGLSGFSAALMSQCIAFGIAHYVFEFEYDLSWFQLLMGTGIGLSVSLIFGSRFIHRVCHAPVMQNLRSS